MVAEARMASWGNVSSRSYRLAPPRMVLAECCEADGFVGQTMDFEHS